MRKVSGGAHTPGELETRPATFAPESTAARQARARARQPANRLQAVTVRTPPPDSRQGVTEAGEKPALTTAESTTVCHAAKFSMSAKYLITTQAPLLAPRFLSTLLVPALQAKRHQREPPPWAWSAI